MLHDASITNALVNFATSVVRDGGLAGIFALMITSAVVGIPGAEVTMLFAGFNVFSHNLTLAGVISVGVVGDLAGALIAYAIGYFGLYELLARKSGPLHIGPHGLGRAHAWFERYGLPAMLLTRLIPAIRSAFPYATGVGKAPLARFIPLTLIGSIAWISALALIGRAVGSQWTSWRSHLEYVDYAAAAVLIGLAAWFIVTRVRGGDDGPPRLDEAASRAEEPV